MKKNYLLKMAVATMLLPLATTVQAVELPYAKAPVDGKTYMLVSRLKPNSYCVPTSWDGSLYLQGYNLDNISNAAVTAQQAPDGAWYFYRQLTTTDEEGTQTAENRYLGIPAGTDNLRIQEYDPVTWYVEQSDVNGFYLLKAGSGQGNELTENGYLHLNNGGEYLVISEPTSQWFPDFYGGVEYNDVPDPDYPDITTREYVFDETGFVIPLNTISRYWAFVELDDVPAFQQKVQLYELITNLEDMVPERAFIQGFQGLLDAVTPIYNRENFTADDLAEAKALIDAKLSLYNEILKAIELLANGQPSAALSNAIETATNSFNNLNDVDGLETALQALKAAEITYAQGSGDLTVLIANNSFEDLTSQGGSMTSGVAGVPTGWNAYVRGQQVSTSDEVRAAGITAWHGINDDAEGALDGNYAFGLWTSGVPEYEISQTLTGLENGSYTVCAALMVGANGNGSRRTTQRIFGNLNSVYFGSEYEYDADRLDQSEVYGFAGLEEPVTDRQLQELQVRAFVYDGTLTIGLRTNGDIAAARRDASNGAGGDGWFKLDNFRLFKEGYIQDDALIVYRHYADLYDKLYYQQMQQSVREQLEAVIKSSVGSNSSQEEIINAIVTLKNLYPTVQASINAYARLLEAIEHGTLVLIEYEYSVSAPDFGDLLGEADDMYQDALVGEEEINAMIARIEEGIEELKATAIVLGDITFVLKNPSFEDLSAQDNSVSDGAQPCPTGWNLYVDGQPAQTVSGGWCAINHGDAISVELEDGNVIDHQYTDGEHLWGIWNSNMPEVELSQTLKNLPVGTYTLQADVMVQFNWAGDNTTTQRIFGNNFVQMWGSEGAYSELNMPEDAKTAKVLTYAGNYCMAGQEGLYNSDLLHPMSVTFDVYEDGIATIGFRTNGINADGNTFATGGLNGQGWFKVDNFRLSYDSEQTQYESGVGQLSNSVATPVRFYSLDGRLLPSPRRGLNIMKTGDSVHKVYMK